MHRSSESIAALAAALAKAQMLLTNPEKSLTATVRTDRYDEPGRTFRYAPLSSGLDIVRKALGQHEIATVQTTAIDQATQAVSLTTVLAHSSGEWIASDWPVCALSEMATPRRMGAALTYARRYALFTLVGIAGEEDLDAPDLGGQPGEASGADGNRPKAGKLNGSGARETLGSFSANRKPWSPPKQALEPEKSAALRDQLLGGLAGLGSQEEAAAWAQRAIPAKNTLTTPDAGLVEAAFASRLARFADPEIARETEGPVTDRPVTPDLQLPPTAALAQLSQSEPSASVGKPKRRARQLPPSAAPVAPEPAPATPNAAVRVNDAVAWHIGRERPVFSGVIRQWLSGGSAGKLRCASAFSWQPQ